MSASASAIDVNWSWSGDNASIDGFEVWRRRSGGSWEIAAPKSASARYHHDGGLTSGTYFDYRVRAYVTKGGSNNVVFSPDSNIKGTTTLSGNVTTSTTSTTSTTNTTNTTILTGNDTEPPDIPTGLAASNLSCGLSRVYLEWNPSEDNPKPGGVGVAGYGLLRWNQNQRTWDRFANTAATSAWVTNLIAGEVTSYAVLAYDYAGNESYRSAWIDVDCTSTSTTTTVFTTTSTSSTSLTTTTIAGSAPPPPTDLDTSSFVVPDSCIVALVWTASQGAASYRVYRWNQALIRWDRIASTTYTGYYVVGLTDGVYTFAVTALNSAGDESYRSNPWYQVQLSSCGDTTTSTVTTTTIATTSTAATSTTSTTVPSGTAWSRAVASPGINVGYAVAVDASGRTTVGGEFAGTVNFGGGSVTSAAWPWHDPVDVQDGFVAQYNANGSYRWARQLGNEGNDKVTAVGVDGAGNVFVAGLLGSWEVDLGGGVTTGFGDFDMFVAKYGPSGQHLWSRRVGQGRREEPTALAVDGAGNVWVVGSFFETTDLGGGTITAAGGLDQDGFVVKYAGATGAHLWSRAIGGGGYDEARAVATDANGNAVVTGLFVSQASFGGSSLTSAGGNDVFLVKYSSTGAHVWSRRYGGSGTDEGWGVAVNPSTGEVVVTGRYTNSVNFGGGTLTSAGSSDMFVAKYSSAGSHVWSRRAGGTSGDIGRSVTVDASGQVTVAGSFSRTADFGSGAMTAVGSTDVFVARYAATGAPLQSAGYGGPYADRANGVGFATDGTAVITGSFLNSIDFGSGLLTSDGSTNAFLAELH